jgi:hypothetical protein
MTWEVRAVTQDGTLVSVVEGVNVESVRRELPGVERMELSLGTLETGAGLLDLFGHEVQLWDGLDFYGWFRPARHGADVAAGQDQLKVTCEGLFSYFGDLFVGEQRLNHIVSPHLDMSPVTTPPTSWTVEGGIEDVAIVDNNAEFWDFPVAVQVNNSDADQDAYIRQRFTVPAELDETLFAAAAWLYISDDQGGSPAWGGPAYNQRGLMIHRLDPSTGSPLSDPAVARLTAETPRNEPVRLQTPEVFARAGELIEVRLYSPAAWVAWRYAHLYDGRGLLADRIDKSAAVVLLAEHAQAKHDHNIGTDVEVIGEAVSQEWPWWQRDNIGEQIDRLADTFEYEMAFPDLTPGSAVRNLRVRPEVGADRTATTLTKEDFVAWSLAWEIASSANRSIRQGEGSGVARDEWWSQDLSALNGTLRERLDFGGPGEALQRLRDNNEAALARLKGIQRLPKVSIVGDLAREVRPGDRFSVDLDHGPAQYEGEARVTAVEFSPQYRRALLDLVPA